MLHTGFLQGDISPLGLRVAGAPMGIGGLVRLHLGEHWRVGTEGYVSTLRQLHNGSYVKMGWGGLLGDFYWTFGRFMPFAGLTVGGGGQTNLFMLETPPDDWTPSTETYSNTGAFMVIDPFVGCDFVVSQTFHLSLKADWLNAISSKVETPSGPRIYLGFIFYH